MLPRSAGSQRRGMYHPPDSTHGISLLCADPGVWSSNVYCGDTRKNRGYVGTCDIFSLIVDDGGASLCKYHRRGISLPVVLGPRSWATQLDIRNLAPSGSTLQEVVVDR